MMNTIKARLHLPAPVPMDGVQDGEPEVANLWYSCIDFSSILCAV